MSLLIEVASLIKRPRTMSDWDAENVYRQGEALAFGLDSALAARGVKRTSFIEQRPNRSAFSEYQGLPLPRQEYEQKLIELDGINVVPGEADWRYAIATGHLTTRLPQLLSHTTPAWYYAPRDFPLPLWVAEPNPQQRPGMLRDQGSAFISVGSVARLRDELQFLDTLLQQHGLDSVDWLPAGLLEAADISLETGLPIIVTEQETE